MAKPAVTVTFLFILFAVSYARFPSDPTENDVTTTNDVIPSIDPDFKTSNTILLPSEKPAISEPATMVEWEVEPETVIESEAKPEPETTESDSKLAESEISVESTEASTDPMPLTVISFRPVNRHFPRRPWFPFRHRHGCRHSRQFKQGGPRFHRNREVNYGDDMILSDGQDLSSSDSSVFRGGVRQIPARWVRFHHGGARFPFKHDDVEEKEEMKRHHHHRHVEGEEHEHEHEHEHKHKHEHEHDHEHEGGFMRGIRKFLNQF